MQSVKNLELKDCKIYQATTSEIFGNTSDGNVLLNEDSIKNPVSIYGISKLAAHNICNLYRDAYNMFIVSGILFNHESSRRGHNFVTQKISNYIGKYVNNKTKKPLQIGNLNAKRDWSHVIDMCDGIYKMLQNNKPENFVLASGETHSIREFIELAFKKIDIDIEWRNAKLDEKGYNKKTNELLVEVNPKYYRDIDINYLIGDASKAKEILKWKQKISFEKLVNIMVNDSIQKFK